MPRDPYDAVLCALLARQLDTWLTGALRRSRRVTIALAYAGPVGGTVEAALGALTDAADRVRGCRVTVVVVGVDPDLPARLAAVTSLPADVAVYPVPGAPDRLPVALKAAGAAGAPTLTVLDDPAGVVWGGPAAPFLTAAGAGRPADLLLAVPAGADGPAALHRAGFPLVTGVEISPADDEPARLLALGTGSDRNLEAGKEAIWQVGATAGLRYRDLDGVPRDLTAAPDADRLGALLVAELTRSGPRTVTELRRHVLTATPYRATDAVRALTLLLDAGTVTREPADGRLGGDVLIHPAAGSRRAAESRPTGESSVAGSAGGARSDA
ncbi:hypothetical protein GA0070618_0239 [Micromonospora echinospora]|uniref:Uncharacterized protein n=1 Tax=Micromonospora echinospora TaxID=1877 RepID=A0A1C4UDR3_MICEC|nr:hypothetical protein [Micromonospora echinospora]SCE69797.1 hypothetical protein GA0070618_0239 [Micromonospora echinospora]